MSKPISTFIRLLKAVIREIDSKIVSAGDMCGTCAPMKDSFKKGETPIRRKIGKVGDKEFLRIKDYEYAYPVDGRSKFSFASYG